MELPASALEGGIPIRVDVVRRSRTAARRLRGPVTQGTVLAELEARYPALRGTIRAHDGGPRRAFMRFFACELDLSHEPPDARCPGPSRPEPSPT